MTLSRNTVILLLALLVAVVSAAPANLEIRATSCKPTGAVRTLTSKYDDLRFSDSPAVPVGIYNELKYENFYVDQYDGFIPAASGTQYAMAYGSIPGRAIRITKPGDSFTLVSFYYACNQGYPQDECKIKVRGNATNGAFVTQEFTYAQLDSSKPFAMSKRDFASNVWSNLASVELVYATIDGDPNNLGFMIDNLVVTKKACV